MKDKKKKYGKLFSTVLRCSRELNGGKAPLVWRDNDKPDFNLLPYHFEVTALRIEGTHTHTHTPASLYTLRESRHLRPHTNVQYTVG